MVLTHLIWNKKGKNFATKAPKPKFMGYKEYKIYFLTTFPEEIRISNTKPGDIVFLGNLIGAESLVNIFEMKMKKIKSALFHPRAAPPCERLWIMKISLGRLALVGGDLTSQWWPPTSDQCKTERWLALSPPSMASMQLCKRSNITFSSC